MVPRKLFTVDYKYYLLDRNETYGITMGEPSYNYLVVDCQNVTENKLSLAELKYTYFFLIKSLFFLMYSQCVYMHS